MQFLPKYEHIIIFKHQQAPASTLCSEPRRPANQSVMEAFVAALPNLTKEELKILLKKIPPLLYFDLKDDNDRGLPSNATTLLNEGTIEVLEMDEPRAVAGSIKMKIKGLEETVNIEYIQDSVGDYVQLEFSIEIGEERYNYRMSPYGDSIDHSGTSKVLKQLHEVLGVPKHQTANMIYLLIYPYCDFRLIREIEAVEKEPGQPPSPKKKCKHCGCR